MARLLFSQLKPGLAALIFVVGARSSAQDIPCDKIRTCPTVLAYYELAAHTCRAKFHLDRCDQADRNTELGKYLKTCSPEEMCREQKIAKVAPAAIRGCTTPIVDGAKDIGSSVWSGVQACREMGAGTCAWTFVTKAVPVATWNVVSAPFKWAWNLGNASGSSSSESRAKDEFYRELAEKCFITEGTYRFRCEIGGNFFNNLMFTRSLTKGLVSGAEVSTAAVRRATVVDRARESVGARSVQFNKLNSTVRPTTLATATNLPNSELSRPAKRPAPIAKPIVKSVTEVKRDDYVRHLVGRQSTTEAERAAFAKLAAKPVSNGTTVFVDVQNTKMKFLNDTFKDKNLVTALTNHRIKVTIDRLNLLQDKYPQMKLLKYDDFKSARMAFHFVDGKVPPGFIDDVKRILNEADSQYIADLETKGILPRTKDLDVIRDAWKSGIADTAGGAGVSTRVSKGTADKVIDYGSPAVRTQLRLQLHVTETLRGGVLGALEGHPELYRKLPDGKLIPSDNVFEAFRKSSSPAEFQKMLAKYTGVDVSLKGAETLSKYLKQLDVWSPGLLIVKDREVVSFVGSKFNGVTIDVSGMGALNMRELAQKMVGIADNDEAIANAAKSETAATAIFEQNKAAIKKAAKEAMRARGYDVDIRISGDDIVVLPKNKPLDADALAAIQDAVAKSPSSSNVRLSAVSSGAAAADNLAVAGESYEKAVRSMTFNSIPDQANYTLMVITDVSGKPTLRVTARTGTVSDEARSAFESAFQKTLSVSK